nr:transposase [uncultured Acetatifactor sp.]
MGKNSTGKGLAAIYRQEIIQDITLFTSQSAAIFYDKLFTHLDFTLPRAATGRRGFPKEAMVCAFIVMKCEGFSQVTDLADYLDNNRLIAHYCGFNIMEPLPSYWTYDRFLKRLNNEDLKEVMAQQVKKLYDLGVVDASFIGLDSTPVAANTKQNNPKSFATDKFKPENHPKSDPDCALGVHSASNQHNERRYEYYWGYKNHVLVDCISGLPLYELTTPANVVDSTVVEEILAATNSTLPLQECTFLGDKGYDVKAVYDLVKDIYNGEAVIPLNKRNTKNPDKLPAGRLLCSAGLAMHKDGKTFDNGRVRQKFCCPLRSSKSGCCPCGHKNWNNGKNRRGCTKYLTLPSDYRLFIDRESLPFKRTYALRTECERYYSRFKASGQERLWVRNANSAANLNSLAHISALAVALAAVLSGAHSYRSAKLLQRSA